MADETIRGCNPIERRRKCAGSLRAARVVACEGAIEVGLVRGLMDWSETRGRHRRGTGGGMWYGDLLVRTRPSFEELPEKEQHDALLTALQGVLYSHFYSVSRRTLRGQLLAMQETAWRGNLGSILLNQIHVRAE